MIWVVDQVPWQQWTLALFAVYVLERFLLHYVADRWLR